MKPVAYIGSYALNHYFDCGHLSDVDFIAPYETIVQFAKDKNIKTFYPINEGKTIFMRNEDRIFEAEVAYPGSCAEEIYESIINDPNTIVNCDGSATASLQCLYMLKMSHRFKKNSPHFKKTMQDIKDIRSFAKNHDLPLITLQIVHPWYDRRVRETYDYIHPKLNQSKKDFFDTPGVVYTYDHDAIHEVVAIGDKPAYRKFMKDGEDVLTDKAKFDALSLSDRIDAVIEESCVLAIERSLVPFPGAKTPFQAFEYALEKVCTSITSGWFREFAWENYDNVMFSYMLCAQNYFDRFQAKRNSIKLHMNKGL